MRVISPIAEFDASLAGLDSPQAANVVEAILRTLADHPERAPLVTGTSVRVLHTVGFDIYPPLVLFYTFDDDAVYPLHVERCDLALF